MSTFFLDFALPKGNFSINHGDGIVLQGSCFSDEISIQLQQSGHSVLSNSFGTIFHPSMLALNILSCFEENVSERILQRDDLFFSWDASSTLFGKSIDELKMKLTEQRLQLKQQLITAKTLIVTFGSAWGYELIETNEMVANCHKVPQSSFLKFLSSPYEMVQDWILVIEKLKSVNPDLQFIFTVSPVRHIKDGLIENNISKARLIELTQQLIVEENCHYFPSYELQLDVLRDYRFYKSDKIHPSEEAVDYIWNQFQQTYFSSETIALNEKVRGLRRAVNHTSHFGATNAQENHATQTQLKLQELLKDYPEIFWV